MIINSCYLGLCNSNDVTKVLITGGTGLIGKHLIKHLINRGYKPAILSRNELTDTNVPSYKWDIQNSELEKKALENTDYIVHLAGANIAEQKWTKRRKQEIIDSRIDPARLLLNAIKDQQHKPKAFISASAVGYYGTYNSKEIFTESAPAAKDFLGTTCNNWEKAADEFEKHNIRVVKIRTGVVLSQDGGFYLKLLPLVKRGLAASLGNGKQNVSWIHVDDLCNIYLNAIEDNTFKGAYNAVSPEWHTNKEFMKLFANSLNSTIWLPNIPAFIIKLIYGEMAGLILTGSRISAGKIIKKGIKFRYPDLRGALNSLKNNPAFTD